MNRLNTTPAPSHDNRAICCHCAANVVRGFPSNTFNRSVLALLTPLIILSQLILWLPSNGSAQSVPYSVTELIVVNGITVKDDPTWKKIVDAFRTDFVASHSQRASTLIITPFYNVSQTLVPDLIQSAQQAVNVPDISPYLNDLASFTDPNQGIFGLIGSGRYLSSFTEEAISNRLTGPTGARPADYVALLNAIKASLRDAKHRVVLVGHSQGNYYVNYAYRDIVADTAFQTAAGITLPNENLLSVVNIADPANWSPDGRYAYVTHCNDIINVVPQHLPSNIGSGLNCVVQDVVAGPLTLAKVGDLITTARTLQTHSDFASEWAYLLNHPLNAIWTTLTVLDWRNTWLYLGRLYFSIKQHNLPNAYLANADTKERIYQLVEDALPDQDCGGDITCYARDTFSGSTYTGKWYLTDYTALGTNLVYGHGEMDLNVSQLTSDPAFGGGRLTLRTRKVFVGPFTASLSFKHITNILTTYGAGYGTSVITIKRAADGMGVMSLTVTKDTGTPTTEPWHVMTVAKSNTRMTMDVDHQTWVGQSADAITVKPEDGFYIEIKTSGNDTLAVSNVSANRTPVVVPPILTPTCSPKPAIITAGQSTVFTGSYTGGTGAVSGVWGGVVSGTSSTATYSTSPAAAAGFGKATYTVTDSGSPKQTATANCQVQINAPAPPTPVIKDRQVFGTAVANVPFDVVVTATDFVVAQVQAWVFDTAACKAGCRHPDSLLTNFTSGGFTLHNVVLAAGDHTIRLRNTDAGAFSNDSASFTVGTSALKATCQPSTQQVGAGATATITGATSGGVAPVTVGWYKQGAGKIASTPTISMLFPSAGTFTFTFTANDSSVPPQTASSDCSVVVGSTATTGTVVVTTTNNVTVPCSLNGTSFNAPATLTNQATGSKALTCSNPSGYTVSSINPTSQNLAAGGTATFAVNLAPVQPTASLTVTPTQTAATLAPGTNAGNLVSVNISYGNIPSNSPLVLSISGLPAGVTSGITSQNVSGSGSISFSGSVNIATTAQPGTYYPVATVSVAGISKTVNLTLQITAPPPPPSLSVQSCVANPSTAWIGQGVVFSVPTPSGGTPPYNYAWGGVASGYNSPTSNAMYPAQGGVTLAANVTVTDSGNGSNRQSKTVSCSVQTYAATTPPQNVTMTFSPSSPRIGQTITINLSGLGFSSNTKVLLFGGSCPSSGCQASNVASSISLTSMQALAVLNNASTFNVGVTNGSGLPVLLGNSITVSN